MNERKIDAGAVFAGLVLLAVGILMTVSRFTDLQFGYLIRHYWPLAVILVGLPRLVRYETLWSGLWLIAIGTWLQLAHLRLLGLTYRNSWPLLLIALGIGTIARALTDVIVAREESHER